MKTLQRPAAAVVAVILGVALLFVGTPLIILSDGGWPWDTTIWYSVDGPTTVEIIDEDGEAYRFTGSTTDARHWMDRKEDELKIAHGIPRKIAVGKVLEPAGLALVLAGLARLLWQLVTLRRTRSRSTGAVTLR